MHLRGREKFAQPVALAMVGLFTLVTFDRVNAVSIWTNPISGSSADGNPYTTGDVKDANITVSGLGATGVTANAGAGRYNWSNWATSLSTDYFSWTLTPNANLKIDF